jgi:hypothetical protein
MAGARKLTLQIFGNAKSAIAALGGTGDAATSMGKRVSKAMPSMKAMGIAGAAAFAAVAASAYKAVEAAAADQKSFKLLEQQLKATVGASDAQVAGVEKQITAMMRATGIADDQLRPAFASLVRGTESITDSTKLMTLALDVSAGTGKDVQTVASALSKAYNGNMGALVKLGIPLDENIKKSKDSNAALNQLSETFGGQAAVAANTFSGRLQIMKTGLGEVVESVGYALLPAMTSAVGFITDSVLPTLGGFSDALTEGGLAGGLQFIADKVKEGAPVVISALSDFVQTAADWIVNTGFPLWVSAMSSIANGIIDWVQPRIPMIIEKMKQFFKALLDWTLNTGLPFLVEKVQKLGDALVGWIGKAAREVPHKLVTFLGEIGAWLLSEAVPKLLELGLKLLGSLIKWTATLGKDLIIGLGGAVVALVAALPDLFMGLLKGLANIGKSAVKWFMSKFSDLAVAIGNLAIGAVNFLIEQFNKIPLIPNIPLITVDLKKAQTQMGLTSDEMDTVSKGMGGFSDAADLAKHRAKGLTDATKDLGLSLGGAGGAGGGAKAAVDAAAKQLDRYLSAMKSVTSASKGVTDATKAVGKAQTDLLKATTAVTTAQARFDQVVRGYGADSNLAKDAERTRAKAQRDLERAGYGVEGAIKAVTDAETALKDLRTDPEATPEMIRAAEIALAEAKLTVADATDQQYEATTSLSEAEATLTEIVSGAKEGSETYADALKDLTDAKDREKEAIERVTDAIDRETEAKIKLADAERELAKVRAETPDPVEDKGNKILAGTDTGKPYGSFMEAVRALHPNSPSLKSKTPLKDSKKLFPKLFAEYSSAAVALAKGGIVTQPTQALIGERGAEAVIPLNKMSDFMGTSINITVNAGMGTDGAVVGQQIIDAIKQAERRSGQVFASA